MGSVVLQTNYPSSSFSARKNLLSAHALRKLICSLWLFFDVALAAKAPLIAPNRYASVPWGRHPHVTTCAHAIWAGPAYGGRTGEGAQIVLRFQQKIQVVSECFRFQVASCGFSLLAVASWNASKQPVGGEPHAVSEHHFRLRCFRRDSGPLGVQSMTPPYCKVLGEILTFISRKDV